MERDKQDTSDHKRGKENSSRRNPMKRIWLDMTDQEELSAILVYEVSSVSITISATFIGALFGVNVDASQDSFLQLTQTYWYILGGFSFGLILALFLKSLMKMRLRQSSRY